MPKPSPTSSPRCVPIKPYPPSPATQVFAIPELLEIILLFLPAKDLLLSQRTARSFRRTIQASIRLKRRLFLAPDWEAGCGFGKGVLNGGGNRPVNNSLLMNAFPGTWPSISSIISDLPPATPSNSSSPAPTPAYSWTINLSFPSETPPTPSNPAVAYPEASWRRMFLSQPPCTSLYLVRRYQRSRRPGMVREDGIRMEEFYEQALKATYGNGIGIWNGVERMWHRSYVSSDRDWHFEGYLRVSSMDER